MKNENIMALAYRSPQRVNSRVVYRDGNVYPRCPRCECALEREYQNYCDRCGQALEWKQYRKSILIYV